MLLREFTHRTTEAEQEMCPKACCGLPVTECSCGPDCPHCDCYEKNKDVNEKMTWARTGKKIVRKFRCVGGRRHGRIVAKVAQCYAAPDPKKRVRLKIMKARLGARLAKKTKRTKRTNPASIRLKQLNKRR